MAGTIQMHDTGAANILKRLVVDAVMGLLFLLLLGFAAWIVWVYYFRGPVDIETRGFVTRTVREQPVQPAQVEQYTLRHFHNLDDRVLAGIESESLCVKCHGDYSHSKTEKVRSFFNAHSWFMACEVCHLQPQDGDRTVYRWLDKKTGNRLTGLDGEDGDYGAMIVPLVIENGVERRLDEPVDREYVEENIRIWDLLADYQKEMAQERIHKILTESPTNCDQCHTVSGALDFRELLYPPQRAAHLESIDMGAMVKGYEEFHLPGIFDPK
jgi:hypothetical protein